MARYFLSAPMYWSAKASGELAAHRASTSARGWPFAQGKSRYSGGFCGFGDQAAALASVARAKNDSFAESAGVFTSASCFSISAGGAPRADRQQGLMMYKAPNTSACFMPMRVVP